MNIALVFPPFYFEPMYNMPPLGLVNLATALKGSHHRVKIFDFPLAIRLKELPLGNEIYDECVRQILAMAPDLAAFSVQCTTYPPALQIAGRLKKLKPELKIVFGGHNAAFVDETTLARFPFVDVIVRGEGEITFPELVFAVERKEDLHRISGLTFRAGPHITRNPDRELIEDLDSLPLSDYGFVAPPSVYRDACAIQRSIAILEVGRGCPHNCIYCSQSLIWKRRTRTFSVGRLILEMKNLCENFGVECFLLAYDQFTTNKKFVEQFCSNVIEAGLSRVPWYCISRLDTVDESLLKLMREAGCESMCYGIDSGSGRTLAFIRKNIDSEILLQRVRETTDRQIVPTLSFVIGFPEERKEDIEQTLRLAILSAISGNANILLQMATTLPGTDLHKRYSALLVREVDTYFSLGIEFNDGKRLPTDDALIDSDPVLFSSFYNLPCPAASSEELNTIANYFSIIASLYPRTFMLLSLELDRPLFDLFFLFLDHVERKTGLRSITPRECFLSFEGFAAQLLSEKGPPVRSYIPEIARYETCLIDAGKHDVEFSSFVIDLDRMRELRPLLNQKILIERFTFNIPIIILDAKFGRFAETYPKQSTYLIFRQLHGRVDVNEINDFGMDFLRLCDGQRNLENITRELYPRYGTKTGAEEFACMCAEAARALSGLMLLVPGPPADPAQRGGDTDAAGKGGRK